MEYIILDNGEKLIAVPTPEEATEYVKECRLEDIAEDDEDNHNYVIKGQEPRAEALAKAKATTKNEPAWKAIRIVWRVITWTLGFIWGIVWFFIKLVSKILACIITSILKLFLFGIQACIFLIVLIVAIKTNVMD